jgi:glycosyl transferase family 25
MQIKAFFINLDRDDKRRQEIEAEAYRVGLNADRFSAFLGLDIPKELMHYFNKAKSNLSRGEIGCYASHLALCQRLVADPNHDAYAIFEDDVTFDDKILESISNISNLSVPWDRIHLTGHAKFSMIEVERIRDFSIVKYSKIPTNGAGYIISKEGAKKFLKFRQIKRALDHDFQRDWQFGMTTLGVYPKPVKQKGHMISAIDTVDPRRRTLSYKLLIDTPFDILKSIYYSAISLGILNFIILQILNLKIEFIKASRKKRIVFLLKPTGIEKFNVN